MNQHSEERRAPFILFAILHLVCCGIPLLLLSGISLAFLVPSWPLAGAALAVLGVIGFIWYLKRGCPTCPRNEGRKAEQRPLIRH
jgi:hypothetical protein